MPSFSFTTIIVYEYSVGQPKTHPQISDIRCPHNHLNIIEYIESWKPFFIRNSASRGYS